MKAVSSNRYANYHLSTFGMTSIERQNEQLKNANEAEALAEATTDPVAKETWKRIAVAYRNLAQMPTAKTMWLDS
jgi:hypothetical protein